MSSSNNDNINRNSIDPLLPRPVTDNTNEQLSEETYEPTAPLANMGVSLSTARILAPLSMAIDFGCQIYGMNSSPNMKDIHDKNLCAFSPQPFAIAGFFTPQQVIQLLWLRQLYKSDGQVERGTLRYVPWYALGNFCIATWMIFWNNNNLKGANVFVVINTFTQLYYMIALRDPAPRTWQSQLTNVVNITFAGIGMLDLFHNTAAAYFPGVPPNMFTTIATAVGAPLTALMSPLLFGACVAYDLFGLAIGQHQIANKVVETVAGVARGGGGEGWARLLGGLGVGVSAIIAGRAYNGANWL